MQLPLQIPNSRSRELYPLTQHGVQLLVGFTVVQLSARLSMCPLLLIQAPTVPNTAAESVMPRDFQPRSSLTDTPQIILLAWILCLLSSKLGDAKAGAPS